MKLLFPLLVMLLILGACQPEVLTPAEQAAVDQSLIEEYVAANQLDGAFTASGLYVALADSGSGDTFPTLSDTVSVVYAGYLLNGQLFDSSAGNAVDFPLNRLIPGWQEGLRLFKRGGMGTLIVPSGQAYGTRPVGSIPANSVLRFDIELVDFY
ncbi:MAG: peptidylprolyl isomerase [Bacteroidetes bacterium]|nr:MAG: peptidylprolyl isomerase [Bacteroidota bacterium]